MKMSLTQGMKPLLLKLGLALSLGFAGYLYSHLRPKRIRPCSSAEESPSIDKCGLKGLHVPGACHREDNPMKPSECTTALLSPTSKTLEEDDNLLLPEFNELVLREFELSAPISPTRMDSQDHEQENRLIWDPMKQEVLLLRSSIDALKERERSLEDQLFEYYGLQERQFAVRELENRLKLSTVEAKFLALKMESLRVTNRKLESQMADHSEVVAELESARAKIKQLKRKIKSDEEQSSEQLAVVQQKMEALQREEEEKNSDILKSALRIKELEDELEEFKRVNMDLESKNAELARKLEATQTMGSAVSECLQTNIMEEDVRRLKQVSKDLEEEMQLLQADRCADAEEVVYLRWVNACLRHELRHYQPSPGKKTAKDLHMSLSPKSEEKAKQLILDNAKSISDDSNNIFMDLDSENWSSSHASTVTETDMESLPGHSINSRSSTSNKSKIFTKLKRLMSGKEGQSRSRGKAGSLDRSDSACSFSERWMSIESSEEQVGRFSCDSAYSCASRSKLFSNSRSSFSSSKGMDTRGTNVKSDMLSSDTSSSGSSLQGFQTFKGDRAGDSNTRSSSKLRRMGLGDDHETSVKHRGAAEKLELLKFAQALRASREYPDIGKGFAHFRSKSFAN